MAIQKANIGAVKRLKATAAKAYSPEEQKIVNAAVRAALKFNSDLVKKMKKELDQFEERYCTEKFLREEAGRSAPPGRGCRIL
jgi:hypothetical protein